MAVGSKRIVGKSSRNPCRSVFTMRFDFSRVSHRDGQEFTRLRLAKLPDQPSNPTHRGRNPRSRAGVSTTSTSTSATCVKSWNRPACGSTSSYLLLQAWVENPPDSPPSAPSTWPPIRRASTSATGCGWAGAQARVRVRSVGSPSGPSPRTARPSRSQCWKRRSSATPTIRYVMRFPDDFTLLALRNILAVKPKLVSLSVVQQWIAPARTRGLFLAA